MGCDCLFRQGNEPEGFMNIDADGLICVPENVAYQAEFLPLLTAVRERFEQCTADLVHSVYVYGSVSRGTAVPKHSDLDLTVLLINAPKPEDYSRLEQIRQQLEVDYPIVTKVDFDVGSLEQMMSPEIGIAWRYWLKHHCRCMYGPDLTIGILPFRPSAMLALAVNGDYHKVLVNYAEKIGACETQALSKKMRREAARKAIRSTNILRTETDASWPLSLDEHAERFQTLFPEKADEIQYFLMHAQGVTAEADDFVGRLIQFADWMDQIKRVN